MNKQQKPKKKKENGVTRLGHWIYKKSNHTLNFKCTEWRRADTEDGPNQQIGPYSYEVDLDRCSIAEWAQHLRETKGRVMTEQDIVDMENLYHATHMNVA